MRVAVRNYQRYFHTHQGSSHTLPAALSQPSQTSSLTLLTALPHLSHTSSQTLVVAIWRLLATIFGDAVRQLITMALILYTAWV